MLAAGPIPPELLLNRWQIHSVLAHLGLGGGLGCEVGVHRGHHAEHILEHWPGDLWLVDSWQDRRGTVYDVNWGGQHRQEDFMLECRRRLAPYGGRAKYHRAFSPAAASQYRDGFFDFVYIDATHTYDAVRADIEAWRPKVREGGLLCGHDYYDGPFGGDLFEVKRAVDEFAAATGHAVQTTSSEGLLANWYMVSPPPPAASGGSSP